MKYTKALVTGGAGFIGSNLSQALLRKGIQVVVLDDLSIGKRENIPTGATFIEGNIMDMDALNKALPEVDIVFHQAARVSIRASNNEFYEDAHTNIMGTLNLLRACIGTEVRKFIYASSMAVYADSETPLPICETYNTEPISPYGIAKLASEKYCLNIAAEQGINCLVLRYFNTYGPGQTFTPYVGVITIFINRLLQGKPPLIFGTGEQRRDFIHVDDIVDANLKAMECETSGEIFNVGTGIPTSVNEIAALLCSRINPNIKPIFVEEQKGELKNSIADISKAEKLLGFSPEWSLEDKIDEVIESIKGNSGIH